MQNDAIKLRELSKAEIDTVSGGIIIVGGLEPGSWVMLNPQPLPPRWLLPNPQPDPPGFALISPQPQPS